ncbi:MAG: M16 family metallopeptidase, partial [Dehalococcoidia bacterium]
SPQQLVDVLLDATLWPGQALGRDVAGSQESVAGLSRDMALAHWRRQYVPNNMVVAVAGDSEHGRVVEAVTAALGGWETATPLSWFPAVDGAGPRCSLRPKKTEQAHLSLAVRGLPLNHPDRYALSLISVILGEGMSSRLFLELREKRGLVYDVHSYVSHFLDTGTFTVYAGVDPKNAYEALQLVLAELARLRDDTIGEEELAKAKEMSKGRLVLRLEDSRAVSAWVGGQETLLKEVRSPEQVLAEVEAVSIGDLKRVASQLLAGDQLYLAVVGPYRSDKRFQALLRL